MPPRKRTTQGDVTVEVEPASAAAPRIPKKQIDAALEKSAEFLAQQEEPPSDIHIQSTTPSKAEVEAAVEKSAEFVAQQEEPPSDVHLRPTTPSKAEVEAAVEQSAEFLETSSGGSDTAATAARDLSQDASPVSAAGPSAALSAAPVSGARDKTLDATPVFSAPTTDTAKE